MPSYILLIYEGEVAEKQISNSIQEHFFTDNSSEFLMIEASHCGEIYSLYNKMAKDSYIDLFSLLKEIPKNTALHDIEYENISEIFLFFDYDGHAPTACDLKLKEMLEHFNEETENGKLYVSYPMVEALKHIESACDFKDLTVTAKDNIHYKKIAADETRTNLISFKKITKEDWYSLIEAHSKKLNFLMNEEFEIPTSIHEQSSIFNQQKTKHITPSNKVAVLSAFPIFITDYFGLKIISGSKPQ